MAIDEVIAIARINRPNLYSDHSGLASCGANRGWRMR